MIWITSHPYTTRHESGCAGCRLRCSGGKSRIIAGEHQTRLKNVSGLRTGLQLSVYQWKQDENGNDIYSPTDNVIVFPRIFTIDNGKSKTIRAGLRVPPCDLEKTYRIYLEELPLSQPATGTSLQVLMRLGVPVYVPAISPVYKARIEGPQVSNGKLSFTLRNTGNTHLLMKTCNFSGQSSTGQELFKRELGSRCVLTGKTAVYDA